MQRGAPSGTGLPAPEREPLAWASLAVNPVRDGVCLHSQPAATVCLLRLDSSLGASVARGKSCVRIGPPHQPVHNPVQPSTIQYTTQYNPVHTTQYNPAQPSTTQYTQPSTTQYNPAQPSTTQYKPVQAHSQTESQYRTQSPPLAIPMSRYLTLSKSLEWTLVGTRLHCPRSVYGYEWRWPNDPV